MPLRGIEQRRITSFDGTSIAYQVRGDGPAIVLSNGLGGSFAAWRHQYSLFGPHYKVLSWDYRGLYRSARPASLGALSVPDQVRDLELVLAAEGVERAVFVGWSMGVQVNFEYYRRRPDQFAGLVVLNGTFGRPFETAFGAPGVRLLIPLLLSAMRRGAPLVEQGARAAVGWNGLIPAIQRLGLVSHTLDHQVFHDLAKEFSSLDFEVYAETMRFLGQHDAEDVLGRIAVPTLVLTGSKDVMTPVKTARRMIEAIPRAELVVLKGGTHYTAVEFPDLVNQHLRRYLGQLDYGPLATRG